MNEVTAVERVKWYTLARKFPQLIGRTPDGARIPGGPYTVTQAVGGMTVLAVGYYSMGLWASFGTFGNYAVLVLVTGAVIVGLGRIPLGARNPVSILVGASRAVGAPRSGRLRGRAVRIRRPHQVRHRIVLCRLRTDTPTNGPQPAPSAAAPITVPAVTVPTAVVAPAPPTRAERTPEPTPAPTAPTPSTAGGRRRPPRRPQSATSAPQLTGVQALMASVGTNTPEDT